MASDSQCWTSAFLLWLGINVADGFWLYFYVKSVVDPIPRTAVNHTSSGFAGYEAMMFIFGLPWGMINLFVSWYLIARLVELGHGARRWFQWVCFLLIIFVMVPASIIITILPFFGGWIVTPIVQNWTWHHRCDGYPMYAILDAKAYNGPSYLKNMVYFYINGNNDVQFTYEISNPEDDDQWYFRLKQWNVDQQSIPLEAYPTLQSIGYNFVDFTLSGNCTVPASPSVFNSNTTSSPCMSGTFDQGSELFFNITSAVPLNNTANANLTSSSSSLLLSKSKPWYVGGTPPAAILVGTDTNSGFSEGIVSRTAVAKPHDCTELKVCIAGVPGRRGSQVMAEALTPLGVILMRQSDYAIACTTPSDD
ncbi:hypothetical protein BDW22DRAFT_1356832 [Trametopsis cervina]|nr:hypothetical protein BDW22DRAFT_1356832 [Trametopsis cervina]